MILLQIAATCGVVFITSVLVAAACNVCKWEEPDWFKAFWGLMFAGSIAIGVPALVVGLIVRIWS